MGQSKPIKKLPSKRVSATDLHIGQRLRIRRLELGMTQETLAKTVGLTFQQIQKYEKGANRIASGRLVELARVLEVDLSYFLGGFGKAGDVTVPSELQAFIATRRGVDINQIMLALDERLQDCIIDLARSLRDCCNE